jgi:release factor glutamine methyltransferase
MNNDEKWLLAEKYAGDKNKAYEADRMRLIAGEPVAYIIGYQPFLGMKIYLDSKPLIPRPETEWWTEKLITAMKVGPHKIQFLDLCAGSGAIGCAVLKEVPNVEVYFGEIDASHKDTIIKNIRENNLDESRAHIGIGNLFGPFMNMQFNYIAANPPYIPTDRPLPESVRNYEPAVALFSGADGLESTHQIAHALPLHLAQGGTAWIECDSVHAAEAQNVFTEEGFSADIRTDQYAVSRVIVVSFP